MSETFDPFNNPQNQPPIAIETDYTTVPSWDTASSDPEFDVDNFINELEIEERLFSVTGLKKRLARRRLPQLAAEIDILESLNETVERDATYHPQAATGALDTVETARTATNNYVSLANFDKRHMTRRLYGNDLMPEKPRTPVDPHSRPRTRAQGRESVVASLAHDRIKKNRIEVRKLTDLWGESILDQDAQEAMISGGRYTASEIRTIRKAGKKARAMVGQSQEREGQLNNRENLRDSAGVHVKSRRRKIQRKLDKKRSSLDKKVRLLARDLTRQDDREFTGIHIDDDETPTW